MAPVDPPNLTLEIDVLVDWLELTALFNEFRIARVDGLVGSLKQLAEEAQQNFGDESRYEEQLVEELENEIELRSRSLGETYPFKLGASAEELELAEDWLNEKHSFYLVCLITSHVTKSPVLNSPPAGALLTRLRNRVFQILSTLALAGLSGGPAISVGWPRVGGEVLLDLLQRAVDNGAGFTVRNPPAEYVSPDEKDGGIDVISWTNNVQPPPTAFYFGQAASGNNWQGKPSHVTADVFVQAYMLDLTLNRNHATFIPFRIRDQRLWAAQSQLHRALVERLRLPVLAYAGLNQARAGIPTDEADQVPEVVQWLTDFRQGAVS